MHLKKTSIHPQMSSWLEMSRLFSKPEIQHGTTGMEESMKKNKAFRDRVTSVCD